MFWPDWPEDDRAKPIVQQYQIALASLLQFHPERQGCVVSCCRCGIEFLTHPRNARRRNLRCPFGCRDHHRRQRSCQRSVAYYKTAVGQQKKQRLNDRRKHVSPPVPCPPPPPPTPPPPLSVDPLPEALPEKAELRLEEVVLDEWSLTCSPMLPYVRMVLRLVEGIELNCREVARLLRRRLRQHSIAYRRRTDYVRCFLHQHPP